VARLLRRLSRAGALGFRLSELHLTLAHLRISRYEKPTEMLAVMDEEYDFTRKGGEAKLAAIERGLAELRRVRILRALM
jgi:hypothetical protein